MSIYFCCIYYSFISLKYIPRTGIAEIYDNSIFNILRNCQVFSKVAELFYIPISSLWQLQFLYTLTNIWLFNYSYPSDVQWHLIVISICISLMAKDIEHLFMYLVAICISSLEKVLLIGSFVFLLLNYKSSLNILYMGLLALWFARIFSHSVDCLFTFFMMSFEAWKF